MAERVNTVKRDGRLDGHTSIGDLGNLVAVEAIPVQLSVNSARSVAIWIILTNDGLLEQARTRLSQHVARIHMCGRDGLR